MHKLTSFILAGLLSLCVALPARAKEVPFTAISNPDFSRIVSIHVPDGWKHRNAEGMMELKPPKGEGYVCVEVFNLDGRTPQQMATLLAQGITLGESLIREGAWEWIADLPNDTIKHFFVGSARDNVYIHFSWADTVDESIIEAILANSVMAGVQVMPAATGTKGDAPSNRVVEVKTAHDLIAAIASNTTIKLAPGRYVLSDAVRGAVNANNGTRCMERADGPQLDITGVRNLTIGGGDKAAEYQIVTDTTHAEVMNFSECEGIKLVGLTMGYTQPGEGSGNVLHCTGCKNIEIENCDLYGSGLYGIVAEFVQGIKMTGGTIRDCAAYLKLADIKGASFTGVLMARRNDETSGAAIHLSEGMNAPVADVVFDRVNFVSDSAQKASVLFLGTCGKGFTVKNCTSRGVNGKEIQLDLGTNISQKQLDGLGFNGEIIKTTRQY